jgi:LysR family glycine cleavage system transcriptional activator
MTLQAAIEGRGIALVPHVLAATDIQSTSLVQVIPKRVPSDGSYFLIGQKRTWEQGKVKIFRDWLRSEVSKVKEDFLK